MFLLVGRQRHLFMGWVSRGVQVFCLRSDQKRRAERFERRRGLISSAFCRISRIRPEPNLRTESTFFLKIGRICISCIFIAISKGKKFIEIVGHFVMADEKRLIYFLEVDEPSWQSAACDREEFVCMSRRTCVDAERHLMSSYQQLCYFC